MRTKAQEAAAMRRRSQGTFNRDHAQPLEYGEDGLMVLGNQYSYGEALELFKEYYESNVGETLDEACMAFQTVIGVGEYEGDITYCQGSMVDYPDIWQAWALEAYDAK